MLYLSAVPFEKLGFPMYGEKPFPGVHQHALGSGRDWRAMLGAAYAFFRKRAQKEQMHRLCSKHVQSHGQAIS